MTAVSLEFCMTPKTVTPNSAFFPKIFVIKEEHLNYQFLWRSCSLGPYSSSIKKIDSKTFMGYSEIVHYLCTLSYILITTKVTVLINYLLMSCFWKNYSKVTLRVETYLSPVIHSTSLHNHCYSLRCLENLAISSSEHLRL